MSNPASSSQSAGAKEEYVEDEDMEETEASELNERLKKVALSCAVSLMPCNISGSWRVCHRRLNPIYIYVLPVRIVFAAVNTTLEPSTPSRAASPYILSFLQFYFLLYQCLVNPISCFSSQSSCI